MLPTPSQQPRRSIRLGKEVRPVAKIMQCDCGQVVRGETDDELVAKVQKHAREVHDMEITRGWRVKALRKGKGGKR
jgi:predicted small metal-binding protein